MTRWTTFFKQGHEGVISIIPDAKGLPNLGKDLTTSEYVRDNADDILMTLLKEGRPSGHELNTTGVDMPPKGGNPSLSDDDLMTIIAYLRSINQ